MITITEALFEEETDGKRAKNGSGGRGGGELILALALVLAPWGIAQGREAWSCILF